MGPIQQDESYFVFEPDQMQLTRGIWHPRLLTQVMKPKPGAGDYTTDTLATMWLERRMDLQSALIKMAEMDWIDPEEACCGVGDATGVANTVALQELPTDALHRDCSANGTESMGLSLHNSITDWSRTERRRFLIAWERMVSVQVTVKHSGACCLPQQFGLRSDLERCDGSFVPLPFILPWPVASDKVRVDPVDLSFDSIALLSSVVRGCPWSLDCYPGVGSKQQIQSEQLLIAQRVIRALHVSNKCCEPIHTYIDTYWPGRRPIGETSPGGGSMQPNPVETPIPSSASASSSKVPHCRYPISVLLRTSYDCPLSASDAQVLSSSLPSSFCFSFGSENLMPWPLVLVAPIAPGWIGGLLMGTNTWERRSA